MLTCVHCGYQLEAEDHPDVCRFCRKSYKLRCLACLEGRDHERDD